MVNRQSQGAPTATNWWRPHAAAVLAKCIFGHQDEAKRRIREVTQPGDPE